jgi:hypothetical protein
MSTESDFSAPRPERRDGPADRRKMARPQGGDRRGPTARQGQPLTSEEVHMRPPVDAGDDAPASENSSLLFERS